MSGEGSVPLPKAVSAGGVVYRRGDHGVEIVLCGRHDEGLWALPKGTPHDGESLEATALREVSEETGLDVSIERKVGSVRYQFDAGGERFDKTVEHYLMVPTGGSLDAHDGEFDEVRWTPAEEAMRMMRYPNERDIVRRALRLIGNRTKR